MADVVHPDDSAPCGLLQEDTLDRMPRRLHRVPLPLRRRASGSRGRPGSPPSCSRGSAPWALRCPRSATSTSRGGPGRPAGGALGTRADGGGSPPGARTPPGDALLPSASPARAEPPSKALPPRRSSRCRRRTCAGGAGEWRTAWRRPRRELRGDPEPTCSTPSVVGGYVAADRRPSTRPRWSPGVPAASDGESPSPPRRDHRRARARS